MPSWPLQKHMFAKHPKRPPQKPCNHAPGGPLRWDLSEHCATLLIVLEPETSHSSLGEEDEAESPPEITPDPDRGFRRLVFSIILQSLLDFTGSRDYQVWAEAKCFLFPESDDKKEHLARLLECSGLDAGWFCDRLEKLRLRIKAPEGQAINRFATKHRGLKRCQAGR